MLLTIAVVRIDTEGSLALRSKMASLGWRDGDVAARIGADRAAVNRWRRGLERPQALAREALRRLLGIPTADWLTEEEANQVQEVRRARVGKSTREPAA